MSHEFADIAFDRVDRDRLATIAAAVAAELRAGDAVTLDGPLAAGKTQFVKDLAEALEIEDEITSPTFTLAHFHEGKRLNLLHVDAYRIESMNEFNDLTLGDFLDGHALVVEWGARFKDCIPPALALHISLDAADRRRVRLTAPAGAWRPRLARIAAALKTPASCP